MKICKMTAAHDKDMQKESTGNANACQLLFIYFLSRQEHYREEWAGYAEKKCYVTKALAILKALMLDQSTLKKKS